VDSGYKIEWTSVVPVVSAATTQSSSTAGCEGCGEFNATSGCITSQDWPQNYPNNIDCSITIHASPNHTIRLAIVELSLEYSVSCQYDYLEIRDGDAEDSLVDTYCGHVSPHQLISSTQDVYITFHSDVSWSASGYKLEWTSVPIDTGCGVCGSFNATSGCVISEDWPQNYPNDIDCTITIHTSANHTILLDIVELNVEHSSTCQYDYLEIRDGGSDDSTLFDTYCGDVTPHQLSSTTQDIYIKFHSDVSWSAPGYRIEWTSVPVVTDQ